MKSTLRHLVVFLSLSAASILVFSLVGRVGEGGIGTSVQPSDPLPLPFPQVGGSLDPFLSGPALGEADFVFQDDKPAAQPVEVKFKLLRSLHMAVDVKMNDAGPRRLIFDLGAPITLVSGRFAAEAGMITKEQADRPAFFGMRGERVAKKFQLGELVAEDFTVMVMDHPTIKAISEFLGPIDGIVGYPFFSRYKFTIDYPAHTMTFTPSDYKPQNVMNQMMGRMFASRDTKKKYISPAGQFGLQVKKPDGDAAPGVTVSHVYPESPAAQAGIESGDRLLILDGRWTDSVADAVEAASFAKAGQSIKLTVVRDKQSLQLELQPKVGI